MRSLGGGACKIGVKSFRHHGAHVANLLLLLLVTPLKVVVLGVKINLNSELQHV